MNNKESNFVSAVICLHEGDTNVISFLEMINNILNENFKKYELICVNDEAGDEIVNDVRAFKAEHDECIISIVNMGFCHGLEAAMNAGIDLSIGDFVFEFDSCFIDYDKSLIMNIYKKSLQGYDIVSAVPSKSKTVSKLFYKVFNHFSETENDITTERFRIISRRAINRVDSYSKTIPYRKAVYASSGLNITSIRYDVCTDKISGKKFDDVEKNNTAIDSLILFTNTAYKFSFGVSIIMAIFMILTGVYTIVSYLGVNKPVAGWAPIMGLCSIGFFAIFLVLTVIIKYLDMLLKLVFRKQKYSISSIEKL